jgi:opacity protein-like surface antigen
MRLLSTLPLRRSAMTLLALGGLLTCAATAGAQGFGVGGRVAWVNPDTDVDADTVRMLGGQVRLVGKRFGLEASIDHRSESLELLNQKVTDTPIQASLLLRMGKGKIAPYLLGGPGWYRRKVESLEDSGQSVSTTEFGWHAGAGLEILAGKHFGIHGDYRRTFLDFSEDDDEDEGFLGGLVPGNRGSMWTMGATIYF